MNLFNVLKIIIVLAVGGLFYGLFFSFDYADFAWVHNKSNYILIITCACLLMGAIVSYGAYSNYKD